MPDDKPSPPAGAAVDARGVPVKDPSPNVLDLVDAAVKRIDDLVDAAVKRIDDLRASEQKRVDDLRQQDLHHAAVLSRMVDANIRERQNFNQQLRDAESKRIDAIRSVDVQAVTRAAEVSTQQASALAAQVQTTAETMRVQVQAAAVAAATELRTGLEPLIKRIAELSEAQYQQQGQKQQVVESKSDVRDTSQNKQWQVGLVISITFLALSLAGFAISLAAR